MTREELVDYLRDRGRAEWEQGSELEKIRVGAGQPNFYSSQSYFHAAQMVEQLDER